MNTRIATHLRLLIALIGLIVLAHSSGGKSFSAPPVRSSTPSVSGLPPIVARVDLEAVAGSTTCHHVITEPGIYYLSGDLDVSKPTGVNIQAEGVMLDLNGFEIRRVSGFGGHGILLAEPADQCVIQNGSVRGFAYGVRAFSDDGVYRRLNVSQCENLALFGGNNWIFDACTIDGRGSGGMAAVQRFAN